MVTYTAQADPPLYFYGTSVQLYGAKRLNHGAYQISVDPIVYPAVNESVPDPGIFQTPLFFTIELASGYHTENDQRGVEVLGSRFRTLFNSYRYIDKVYRR